MASLGMKGLKAYQQDLLISDQASISEPNQLIDELIEEANSHQRPIQEKETLKHLVATDIKHQMPPQMYAIVASLAKMIDAIEQGDERGNPYE